MTILIMGSVAVMIIGYIDYITGYEISMFEFYAFPIMFVVWFGDKQTSILTALLCGLVWWWADAKAGHPYLMNWIQWYNAFVRLIFFLFVVVGGTALKKQIELMERSRRLEGEIIKISEREQQRIGQDLHDGLCQYLAAITCAAGSLRNDLQKVSPKDAKSAAEIAELLKQGVTQARGLSRGLFPVQLDESGLASALHELAASSTALLQIQCVFAATAPVPVYDNIAATHLYRICQEALNNATRHGKATRVRIKLEADGDIVTLSITDNGRGFSANGRSNGMGLKIMDYRTSIINGRLNVTNNAAGGVTVSCSFRQNSTPNEEKSHERAS